MVHVPESSQSDYNILRINVKSGNNTCNKPLQRIICEFCAKFDIRSVVFSTDRKDQGSAEKPGFSKNLRKHGFSGRKNEVFQELQEIKFLCRNRRFVRKTSKILATNLESQGKKQ